MRTLKSLLFAMLLFAFSNSHAQVSVNVNIGNPPVWAPEPIQERYYYLPEIKTYYDLNTAQYVYINNGRWIRTATLPVVYRNYDLYHGQRVVVTSYRGNRPYYHYKGAKYIKKGPHGNGNWKGHGHGNGHGHGKH